GFGAILVAHGSPQRCRVHGIQCQLGAKLGDLRRACRPRSTPTCRIRRRARAHARAGFRSVGLTTGYWQRWAGPPMSTASMSQLRPDDGLQVLGSRTGVGDFPTVLAVLARHGQSDTLDVALDRATQGLIARGLIADGLVAPEMAAVVRALHRPDRE